MTVISSIKMSIRIKEQRESFSPSIVVSLHEHPCRRQRHICCLRLSHCQLLSVRLTEVAKSGQASEQLPFHRAIEIDTALSYLRMFSFESRLPPSLPLSVLHHSLHLPNIEIVFANSTRPIMRRAKIREHCIAFRQENLLCLEKA